MLVAASTLEYAIPLRPVPWAKLGGNSKPAACPSFAAPVFGANLGISAQIVISNYDTLNRLTNIQDFQLQNYGRVPLDKNEGGVNGIVVLGSAETPLFSPERLRTKTLEISR
jgi:hypothetical protein